MTDRRSFPPHEDELSLALLRSAEHDEPSAAAYSKVATALGVGAAVGLGASLPALASSGLSASAAARWSGSLLAKGAAVGVSSVLLAVGGIQLLAHRSGGPQSAPRAASVASVVSVAARASVAVTGAPAGAPPAAAAVSEALAEPALARAVPAPTPNLDPPLAPVVQKSPQPANAAQIRSARPVKASSLPQQVLSLDRARVALNSGDAGAALAEIAHYRSAWPTGVFLTEASVLEIQALAKRGEVALAATRARAFVTAHPDSPQAERLRALIPGGVP